MQTNNPFPLPDTQGELALLHDDIVLKLAMMQMQDDETDQVLKTMDAVETDAAFVRYKEKNGDRIKHFISSRVHNIDNIQTFKRITPRIMQTAAAIIAILSIGLGTDVSWTKGTNRSGDGNPTPHAVLKITPEGKVASAVICFDYAVEKSAPDGRPILDWREILTKNAAYIAQAYGTDSSEGGVRYPQNLTLVGADPLLYVNDQSVTFPAWTFIIQRDYGRFREEYPELPEPGFYDVIRLIFDARTGENVR